MAQSCSNCQFAGNVDTADTCQVCGVVLGVAPLAGAQSVDNTAAFLERVSTSLPANAGAVPPCTLPRVSPEGFNTPASATQHPGQAESAGLLTGRITWLDQTMENADFNGYRFGVKSILFLVSLPLFIIFFTACLTFSLALSLIGLRGLAQGLKPFSRNPPVNIFGVFAVFFFPRSSEADQVPVTRLTVQTTLGERAAIIKGALRSGALRRGDQVDLAGAWKNGTLIFQNGHNNTLRTALRFRRQYWPVLFYALLLALFSSGTLVYQWVQQ